MDCPKCEMPDSLEFIDKFYNLEKKDNEVAGIWFEMEIWSCALCKSLFYKTVKSGFIEKLEIE